LDDEDAEASNNQAVVSKAQHLSANLQSGYTPQAVPAPMQFPTAAAFPGSPASVLVNQSVVPEMVFTLQNGNAVLMQPPTPTMRLVSPLNTSSVQVPVQVSSAEFN